MNSLFQASVAAGPSERSVSLRWWYSDDLWHRRQVGSGGLIEFELAIQVGRCDRWRSGWQADGVEKRLNRRGRSESSYHLHATRATGTHGDIILKHSRQQLGP